MTEHRVTTEKRGHLWLMGLNRPEKINAFDLRMLNELSAAYEVLGDDPELRVGILYAHGDHFCAGLDLAAVWSILSEKGPGILAGASRYDPLGVWKPAVPKPVILAVQGIAYTISIELALAADIVVTAENVRFRQLEVGRGILPFGGATFRAPAQLGWGNAMQFLLTAEEFGAEEALRIGLVQDVVPTGKQLARAAEIGEAVAQQAPLGVQETLTNARIARAEAERAATAHLDSILPRILDSEDAAEGLQSFRERRPARFAGNPPGANADGDEPGSGSPEAP